jgi:hypothetical protein
MHFTGLRPSRPDTHVVDDNVDTLDVDTTTEDVGGDENTLLECLELLESSNAAKCQHG